jgi:hypothetical protein
MSASSQKEKIPFSPTSDKPDWTGSVDGEEKDTVSSNY